MGFQIQPSPAHKVKSFLSSVLHFDDVGLSSYFATKVDIMNLLLYLSQKSVYAIVIGIINADYIYRRPVSNITSESSVSPVPLYDV